MGKQRKEKVEELIKQEISKLLLNGIKDPRIGFVTVTDIKMTSDLKNAIIFISIMGGEARKKECMEGLKSSIGFIRREIGKAVRLRYTPEISFEIDETLDYSLHIQKLLDEVETEKSYSTDAESETKNENFS